MAHDVQEKPEASGIRDEEDIVLMGDDGTEANGTLVSQRAYMRDAPPMMLSLPLPCFPASSYCAS